jgi:hypothetical protein
VGDSPTDEAEHRCSAEAEMVGRTFRCDKWRGHGGIHYSDLGRPLSMVQWPDGWQHE